MSRPTTPTRSPLHPALAGLLLALAATVTPACGGGGTNPNVDPETTLVVRDVPPATAVEVFQMDFLHPQGDVLDSTWGRLQIDPSLLVATTGLQGGFLNVAMGDRWVARNVPVLPPSEPPYSVYFDLGLAQTQKLVSVALHVKHSNLGLGGLDEHLDQEALYAVERWRFNAEQNTPFADPGSPPASMMVTDRVAAALVSTIRTQMVTNVQCAHNQCMTMAAANAYQYLEDMGQITLPHAHVPGGLGDNTLVGQFDLYSPRGGTSRSSGNGLAVTPMVDGSFEYLSEESLSGILSSRHQNTGVGWTMLGAAGGDHLAHGTTSWDDGSSITHGWIYDRIGGGCGVVAVYQRDSGGGHAGRITAAGYDDTGRRWIRFSHDTQQTNIDPTDSFGLDDAIIDLEDLDGDGMFNIWTVGRELQFVWAIVP